MTGTASPGDPLGPLRAQSTPALIADLLRAEVLAGTFPPHSQLSEAHLARQLQVSRGPVREAMQRLIQEGLLRSERNRGVFVVALGHDDARDVYLARGIIEGAWTRPRRAWRYPNVSHCPIECVCYNFAQQRKLTCRAQEATSQCRGTWATPQADPRPGNSRRCGSRALPPW